MIMQLIKTKGPTVPTVRPVLSPDQASEEAQKCFHCGHCQACGLCVEICPGDVLIMVGQRPQLAYPDECIHCGACLVDCPNAAIAFHIPLPMTIAAPADKTV